MSMHGPICVGVDATLLWLLICASEGAPPFSYRYPWLGKVVKVGPALAAAVGVWFL